MIHPPKKEGKVLPTLPHIRIRVHDTTVLSTTSKGLFYILRRLFKGYNCRSLHNETFLAKIKYCSIKMLLAFHIHCSYVYDLAYFSLC